MEPEAELSTAGPAGALSFLVGVWRGEGHGVYPTIDAFDYDEEIVFSATGKPFLAYAQRSWAKDGRPLHVETGYWRPGDQGAVEVTIAQPTGFAEVAEGTVVDRVVDVSSKMMGRTSTAKEVSLLRRVIEVKGDVLEYRIDMAAVGQPMQNHLRATLRRA